jgi:hypothetical protein
MCAHQHLYLKFRKSWIFNMKAKNVQCIKSHWVCFEAKWHFFLFLVSFEIFPHTVRSTPRSLTPFVSSNFSNMMKHFTLTERDRTAASHHEEIINHSCIIQVWIRVVFTSFCYILLDIQNDHTSLYVTT